MLSLLEESSLVIGLPVMVILFYYKRKSDNGNHFLALTLLCMWYALFINRLNSSREILQYPYFIRTGNIAAYQIFSFLYLYTRKSFYPGIRFHKTDWLFFAPALFYVVDMTPFYLSDPSYKIEVMKANFADPLRMSKMSEGWVGIKGFHFVFRYLWSVFMMILQVRMVIKNRAPGSSAGQPWNKPFHLFILTLTLLFVPLIIPGIFGVIFHMRWYTLVFINLDMAFTILATGLFILFSPRVLYGFYPLPLMESSGAQAQVPMALSDVMTTSTSVNEKEDKLYMNSSDTLALLEKVDRIMREKKPFLSSDYTIHDLSWDTQIPVYQLSPLINHHYSSNFRSWINKFRVEYFLGISQQEARSEYTLDALAQESGFSNRATFINAFKKEMGTTPGEYLKRRLSPNEV